MQIMQELLSEHDHIRSILRHFKRELEKFAASEAPDYEVLEGSISYCREYLDKWHHPREDALFEAMQRRNAESAAALEEIGAQHGKIAAETATLARIFADVRDRGAVYLREELVNAGRTLGQSYDDHLEWEEARFFPRAAEILTDADWLELAKLAAGPGDPLMGKVVEQRYQSLVRLLGAE